jgi:hypothetical protein
MAYHEAFAEQLIELIVEIAPTELRVPGITATQ